MPFPSIMCPRKLSRHLLDSHFCLFLESLRDIGASAALCGVSHHALREYFQKLENHPCGRVP